MKELILKYFMFVTVTLVTPSKRKDLSGRLETWFLVVSDLEL